MALDREKLIKMLGLTTSNQDGEALAAIRMVNAMLLRENLTWAEVLAAKGNVVNITLARTPPQSAYKAEEDWVAPHLKDKVTLDLMFRAIFAQPRVGNEDFWKWVDSVHEWYVYHKSVTPKMYVALRNCYQRAVRS